MSWCKVECVVGGIDCVGVAKEQTAPPPLVIMSLSIKITLNPKNGTNEVCLLLSSCHHANTHMYMYQYCWQVK